MHVCLRRNAEWFTGEQTRAARKAGPNRAAFGRAAKHLHAQQHSSCQRSRGPHCLPVPPLQAGSLGPLAVPLAVPLPEPRRKESSVKLKAKAEKTKRGYLFRLPGQLDFWPIRTQGIHGENRIIFTNRDTRKYIEIHRNSLEIFRYRQLNTTRVFF